MRSTIVVTARSVGLLLFSAVIACGPADGDGRIIRFTATPTTLPAGGGPVEIQWETEDATQVLLVQGDIELDASGARTLTVTEDTTLTLKARSGTSTATAELKVTVERIAVSGQVVDEFGAPAPGIEVSFGEDQQTTTDATGKFAMSNVVVPYSVRLRDPNPATLRLVRVWDSLTTTSPTLSLSRSQVHDVTGTPRQFTLTGTFTGGVGSTSENEFTLVLVVAKHEEARAGFATAPASGAIGPAHVTLSGPETQNVDVMVVQMRLRWSETTMGLEFTRAAIIKDVTLTANGVTDLGAVLLTPTTTRKVRYEVQTGDWAGTTAADVAFVLPGRRPVTFLTQTGAEKTVELSLPEELPGATIEARGFVWGRSKEDAEVGVPTASLGAIGVPPDATQVSVSINAPPTDLRPRNAELRTQEPQLSWKSSSPVCVVNLGGAQFFEIVTPRKALPAKWRARMGLTGGSSYHWTVTCLEDVPNIDAALAEPTLLEAALSGAAGHSRTRTAHSNFTVP